MRHIQQYIRYRHALNYAARTIERDHADLLQFSKWIKKEDKEVSPGDIQDYYQYLKTKSIQQRTIVIKIKTLKRYFEYLILGQYILFSPCHSVDDLIFLKRHPIKNILTIKEAQCLISAPTNSRDKAILELLYSTAMRSAELYGLNITDINLKENEVHIRDTKTREDRIVPIGRRATKAVKQYLLNTRPTLMRQQTASLFLSHKQGKRINAYRLRTILKKYTRRVGINTPITPHSLRHSCATHMLHNGAPIEIIQRLLGHRRLQSTEIYTQVPIKDLKQTLRQYHPRGK